MNKKLLLFFLLSFSLPSSAQLSELVLVGQTSGSATAPTVVQYANCKGTSPLTCSFSSGATAGDSVVLFSGSAFLDNCTGVTSTPSNTFQLWNLATNNVSATESVFVATNVASGTNSIITSCSGSTEEGVSMIELTPSVPDVTGQTFATGTAVSVSTAEALGTGNEYVAAAGWNITGTYTWMAGTGFTGRENMCLDSISCSSTEYGLLEDKNITSGLSGVQTATETISASHPWVAAILAMAPNVAQSANVNEYINWIGLSNTVEPTLPQLQSSTYGPAGTWSLADATTALTGTTAANPCTKNYSTFQLGATNWIGNESATQLLYTTVTGGSEVQYTFPTPITGSVSWGGCIYTNIPQNETAGHRYSLTTIETTTTGNDYADPQIRTTGTTLDLYLECPAATQSSTDIVLGTSPQAYWYTVYATTGGTGHNHQLAIYTADTNTQVGTTLTCVSETGPYNWAQLFVGDTGSETEGTGNSIIVGPTVICYNAEFPCGLNN